MFLCCVCRFWEVLFNDGDSRTARSNSTALWCSVWADPAGRLCRDKLQGWSLVHGSVQWASSRSSRPQRVNNNNNHCFLPLMSVYCEYHRSKWGKRCTGITLSLPFSLPFTLPIPLFPSHLVPFPPPSLHLPSPALPLEVGLLKSS